MPKGPQAPKEIIEFYEQYDEADRLFRRKSVLEFARMQELLQRYLPPAPAVVLDVGGGPGAYATWLAKGGYEVHLVDATPKHIEQAMAASAQQPQHPIASMALGDARRLLRAKGSADAVLLMGPLYHLVQRKDRFAALREARRVTRPDGVVFAVGVHKFASLFDGLVEGLIDDPEFAMLLDEDLRTGQHRNRVRHTEYFTTAKFHHWDELRSEVSDAGFNVIDTVSVQGPGWLAKDFQERWADPKRREQLLSLVRAVEHDPSLAGVSQHFVVVGKKGRKTR
ncbi:MAG: class I SAM-dependent methyltransferase [Chloroflexi bacterium]|nr:class I SAM-dependent methyltransferase [Chloroflexota bacterium]